ncbi:hypothetical protein EI94DRAFT_1813867 [Lactarius quietus]|nr:hypothetical protein EI94DRAFT_1813867 [Lactarius quietus]
MAPIPSATQVTLSLGSVLSSKLINYVGYRISQQNSAPGPVPVLSAKAPTPLASSDSTFRSPRPDGGAASGGLDGFYPVVGCEYAAPVHVPEVVDNNTTGHAPTVDLAGAVLNNVYGSDGDIPRFGGLEEFRR